MAGWLLLLETVLGVLALFFDSFEAQQALNPSAVDLSNPATTAFALVTGPLFILPVLVLLVLAAVVVGIRPRGGRWLTLPSQLAALLVVLISLRGPLEVVAALAMALVALLAELLLFRRPRAQVAG